MDKKTMGWIGKGIMGLVVLILFFGSWYSPGVGEVSVVYNILSGSTYARPQGTYLKVPIINSVSTYDVKTQRADILECESASKDLQKVVIHIALNYHLLYDKVNELHVKVGTDYNHLVIDPAINECIKAAVSQFPVEEIIVQREKLRCIIENSLKERLDVYNIVLESLNLINISFDPKFNEVVEAKQIEEQKIKTAEYIKKQAEQNKQAVILTAEGKAREQELLRATVSPAIISLEWIKKWDGSLPAITTGGNTPLFINPDIGKITK